MRSSVSSSTAFQKCRNIVIYLDHYRIVDQIFHYSGERHNTASGKWFHKNMGL